VMADPAQVDDAVGEWFELQNVTGDLVALGGCTVTNQASGSVTLPSPTNLALGARYVLARSTSSAANGGLTAQGTFSFDLATAGSLTLTCGGQTVDTVSWTGASSGTSRSLDPDHLSAVDDDTEANWCVASAAYGLGDLGTPGGPNPDCP
jgi:hypothetical protein